MDRQKMLSRIGFVRLRQASDELPVREVVADASTVDRTCEGMSPEQKCRPAVDKK